MVEADPNLFFKYSVIDENTFKVLKNQELYFSHTSEFNDPFDSKTDLIWCGKYEDWNRIFFENKNIAEIKRIIDNGVKDGIFEENNGFFLLRQPDEGFQTIIEKMQSKMNFPSPRVCCFSQEKNNILMWSHYANRHKGICLCFKSKQTIDSGNVLILIIIPRSSAAVGTNHSVDFFKRECHINMYDRVKTHLGV